jgi:hypothetical protein
MADETVTIPVTRYRDEQGRPTCAADFNAGRVCAFLRSRVFCCDGLCTLRSETVLTRVGDDGTLAPLDNCPLWREGADAAD